jgi:uncharacterized protein (DUF488 family)
MIHSIAMGSRRKVVYTLGYQGITIERYIGILQAASVGIVVDVREVPWSHKPGFCKSYLQKALDQAGIRYVHVRAAGNPSSNRRTAKSAQECLRRYRTYLRGNEACINDLLSLLDREMNENRSACLTCFERFHGECHRSILTEFLAVRDPELSFVHLPQHMPLFNGTTWVQD